MNTSPTLVLGALGGQGGAVVRAPARGSATGATTGVTGAFTLTTPFESGPDAEVSQGQAIFAAARRCRIKHLVFSSVAGASKTTGVPHFDSKHRLEIELAHSDIPYTIVAPSYFFDNALGGEQSIRHGRLEVPMPADRALQQLDREDHGRFVAHVLAHPEEFVGQRIELASADMAAMWAFLQQRGYQVDLPTLRENYAGIGWTSFASWAGRLFTPSA